MSPVSIWENGKIHCLGCGPGSPEYVTPLAAGLAAQAELLIGCERCQDLFPLSKAKRLVHSGNLGELLKTAEEALDQGLRVAWLCTGDTGLRSVASTVRKALGLSRVRLEPGISSVQIACARLGLDWSELQVLSAHGREPVLNLYDDVDYIVLAGSPEAAPLMQDMAQRLEKTHTLLLCQDLGLGSERITNIHPDQIQSSISHPRALLVWKRLS